MFSRVYLLICVAIIGFYALSSFKGWEFGNPARQTVPASVRQSPGGYRSFHFWHSGFHGGK
ncbi:MAG TPA: hypothetical protein VJX67_02505 [Blastocatellia bacterium]|nr:hypothetical protein [Blastocatellia bacterium]